MQTSVFFVSPSLADTTVTQFDENHIILVLQFILLAYWLIVSAWIPSVYKYVEKCICYVYRPRFLEAVNDLFTVNVLFFLIDFAGGI